MNGSVTSNGDGAKTTRQSCNISGDGIEGSEIVSLFVTSAILSPPKKILAEFMLNYPGSKEDVMSYYPPPEILKVDTHSNDASSERSLEGKRRRDCRERSNKKTILIWAIVVGVLSFGIALWACIANYEAVGLTLTILVPIGVGYALLADVFCIFNYCWISDLFLDVATWSVRFPGIIFSFSLDGLKFLILMKLLFWFLGVLISVTAFFTALALSAFFSVFCFPYYVFKKD